MKKNINLYYWSFHVLFPDPTFSPLPSKSIHYPDFKK